MPDFHIEKSLLKKVIGVSGGMIYFTPLLLGYSIDQLITIFINTDQKNILNYDIFSKLLSAFCIIFLLIYFIFTVMSVLTVVKVMVF